ncbi:MAG: flavodoxin-dependent (E)-4-hydroxy-3-methylbut-2-enyl-diphosphate synthase [Ruminococcaceae bacterium]|nr:flavodoxin-dependent (E)-4-hydroxy-3-methylbut-2-enyl-diphosphate synthase [Oscillospiraceae bacterium]
MNSYRRKTSQVRVGGVMIGGDAPIAVQSMCSTDTHDAAACLAQTEALAAAGCDIVRLAAPDKECAETFSYLKERGVTVPLVADIHFDYRIALECAAAGADKIRINPGNIGDDERVRAVVRACREKQLPIRIGVNSGSLEKHILAKYGAPTAEALAESALYHVALLEKFDFTDIVISIKASTVREMIAANRVLAEKCSYPLHLGVTEAGTAHIGTIKSAAGIGALLCDGIGDTIRVSLTDDPVREVMEAHNILRALELEETGINLVSCPTCGRTQIPLIDMVNEFEARRGEITTDKKLRVAMMGCIVNGPGEAREADIGIAGGRDEAVLFRHGEIVKKIPARDAVSVLIEEINLL